MKTYHEDFCGCTASITDLPGGTARLIIRDRNGKKIKDSTHKNRKAALAAWRRFCN